jgi:hypothetical protein
MQWNTLLQYLCSDPEELLPPLVSVQGSGHTPAGVCGVVEGVGCILRCLLSLLTNAALKCDIHLVAVVCN